MNNGKAAHQLNKKQSTCFDGVKLFAIKNTIWEKNLKRLVKWIEKEKGYIVYFGQFKYEKGWVELSKKQIFVSTRHNTETILYLLLHEIGHVILFEAGQPYKQHYDLIWDNFSSNSLVSRITIFQEELDAWREGLMLAKSLKIKTNRRKFEIIKARSLATYLPWIIEKTAYKEQV